jgi:hypothetical protein
MAGHVLKVFVLAAVVCASSAFATEPKSDLALEVRVVDTVLSRGPLGRGLSGVARLDVALDSFRDAENVTLRLETPDGRPLSFRPLAWRDARGFGLTPGDRGIVVPARGRILTRLEIPLEGESVHRVVVKATALSGAQEASTEAFVLVPLGDPKPAIKEDPETGLANFQVKGAE